MAKPFEQAKKKLPRSDFVHLDNHNLLKILYIKRISHCFRYCQLLRYKQVSPPVEIERQGLMTLPSSLNLEHSPHILPEQVVP